MAIKLNEIKFENLKFEFTKDDFKKEFKAVDKNVNLAITVDPSADYTTNADEYFRKAMIGENSSRSRFRQVLGVKDRVKLGTATFDSLIKAGACDFDPSNSEVSQKTFEVTPLMVSTSLCVSDLEQAFMSDQISRGSSSFDDNFAFMNYFYETLSMEHQEELETLTWQGNIAGGLTGSSAYLNTVDGLETTLAADVTVQNPVTASVVTSANIIAKLVEARDGLDKAVKQKGDFVYMLSTNAVEAYKDAISENQASGQYYVGNVTLNFQGTEIIEIEGASDNVIVAGSLNNFLNIQDLLTDETGYEVVDFYKTQLDRRIGVRTDFKFKPDYIIGEEIYFHKP